MLARSFGLWASLALAADSILIPSTLPNGDTNPDLFQAGFLAPDTQVVKVSCPGCPYAVKNGRNGDLLWAQGITNSILMSVEVQHGDGDSLLINGIPFYSSNPSRNLEPMYIYQVDSASQVIQEADGALSFVQGTPVVVTGYQFHFSSAETVTEEGLELLPMLFSITSIDGHRIHIPKIRINVLKDNKGRLHLASVETIDTPQSNDADCEKWPLYCKVRAMMLDGIRDVKSKLGKTCHKARPHHFAHKSGHGRHRYHHNHHRNRWARLHTFMNIMVPIVCGIAFGTVLYAVRIVVGSMIASMATAFGSSRSQGYVVLDAEDDMSALESDSKELHTSETILEAPPVYEDVSEKEASN